MISPGFVGIQGPNFGDDFIGLGDVVPGMTFGVSNQRLFAGQGTNNAEIRVIAATSDIGYENNSFSGTEWDTATTSGANSAFTSTWYDQVGSDDPGQGSITLQPETTRKGVHVFDGSNDYMTSPYKLTDGDNWSVLLNINTSAWVTNDMFMAFDDTSDRALRIYAANSTNLNIRVWKGGGADDATIPRGDLGDGSNHLLGLTWDSSVGLTASVDGVSQTVTGTAGGTVDVPSAILSICATATGGNICENEYDTICIYNGASLSPQNHTDIYNQYVINDAL